MKRSASKIINNLEQRIARLEGKTANKYSGLKISTNWFTGSPRENVIDMTFKEMIKRVNEDFARATNRLEDKIEDGRVELGTNLDLYVEIAGGKLSISWSTDDGSVSLSGGCECCLWQAFVATGCSGGYKGCASSLRAILKSKLSASATFIISM